MISTTTVVAFYTLCYVGMVGGSSVDFHIYHTGVLVYHSDVTSEW